MFGWYVWIPLRKLNVDAFICGDLNALLIYKYMGSLWFPMMAWQSSRNQKTYLQQKTVFALRVSAPIQSPFWVVWHFPGFPPNQQVVELHPSTLVPPLVSGIAYIFRARGRSMGVCYTWGKLTHLDWNEEKICESTRRCFGTGIFRPNMWCDSTTLGRLKA